MDSTTTAALTSSAGWGRLLRRGRSAILASVGAFSVIGLCLSVFTTPTYRASVRIEIPRHLEPLPGTGQPAGTPSFQSDRVAMLTTAELIANRVLLGRLAGDLARDPGSRLAADPGARRSPGWLRLASADAGERIVPLENQVERLRRAIHVEPVQDTRLVDIRVEHSDPERARTMADRLARLFVEYVRERSAQVDTEALAFLDAQIDSVRSRLIASEQLLYGDRDQNIASLRARAGRLGATVSDLNSAYTEARTERLALGARLARLKRMASDPRTDVTQLPVESRTLDQLRAAIVERRSQVAAARRVFRPLHPKLAGLESELATLEATMRDELGREITRLRGEHGVLSAREVELRRALARAISPRCTA